MKYTFPEVSKNFRKLRNVEKTSTTVIFFLFTDHEKKYIYMKIITKKKKNIYKKVTYISEASGSRFVYLNYYFPKASEKKLMV